MVKIAWYGKHFGEEPPLVGEKDQGAGTIFFSGCNLRCVFCQNYQISQESLGSHYTEQDLVDIMLELQEDNAATIDLVTPTIWWKQIKQAILEAKRQGLHLPIVWNTNGYEHMEMLKEIEGLVDIYLPDYKYGINEIGKKYSGISDYVDVAKKAIREMYRQVRNLKMDKNGLAQKGLIIRHLVLPNNIENSYKVLQDIAAINKDIFISLMSQYTPIHKAHQYAEINCLVDEKDFEKVWEYMVDLGMEEGWVQEGESCKVFAPDFRKKEPFGM